MQSKSVEMAKKVIRKVDLPSVVGLRRTAIDEAIRGGTFPPAIPLSNRAVGWVADELDAWIEWRRARRDGVAAPGSCWRDYLGD